MRMVAGSPYTFEGLQDEPVLVYFPASSAPPQPLPATIGRPAGTRAVRRGGLTLSHDGRRLLYARLEGDESDLVLVETR
jgi:hypothetical protein